MGAGQFNKGNALYALGRKKEAIAFFDKAIEIYPDFHEAWKAKGVILRYLGRREESKKCIKMAVELAKKKNKK